MRRKKFYDGIEAMQKDLDAYLVGYNTERPVSLRGRPSSRGSVIA